MPTYTYETVPGAPGAAPRRFDVRQAMSDPPLTHDPETGEPVRRVITGGAGPLVAKEGNAAPPAGGCGPSCGCGH